MTRPIIAEKKVTKYILNRFNLHTSKRLGQNFLIDPILVKEIVEEADIKKEDNVLEIGPGIGTLTQVLAETGANIKSVEIDRRLIDILSHTLEGYDNVEIINGDILKVDINDIMGNKPFKVVANLPYYITTPIIMELLEKNLPIESITVMVQKEVAERMVAKPGGKTYGALSVAVQYYTDPEIVLAVPPKSFMPPPEVDSVVIRCDVLVKPKVDVLHKKTFFSLVKAAFGQRRKTLNNAIKTLGIPKEIIDKSFDEANIDAKRRGETLSLLEFATLSNKIYENTKNERE